MTDLNSILSMIENPTRRMILTALVKEPHYPLQLSKELGISQQAIMKNLDILEKGGLVVCRKEASSRGPSRIVYQPTSEFTLTIDLRTGMFKVTLREPPGVKTAKEEFKMELEEVRECLSDIDRQINEFDRMREALIEKRNLMICSFMDCPIAHELGYTERSLLYEMLNSPEHDLGDICRHLGVRDDLMIKMVDNIKTKKESKR